MKLVAYLAVPVDDGIWKGLDIEKAPARSPMKGFHEILWEGAWRPCIKNTERFDRMIGYPDIAVQYITEDIT